MIANKGWSKGVVAGARKLAVIAFHMLKNHETYRYGAPQKVGVKLSRIRYQVTGEKKPPHQMRFAEELKSDRPKGDVDIRYIQPLSDLYESEGLSRTKSYDELSKGEKRVLKEMGLAEQVKTREKVQVIVKPKKTKTTPEKNQTSSPKRHTKSVVRYKVIFRKN